MVKRLDKDYKIFFKLGVPLVLIGIAAASIGEHYWQPLFLAGFVIIFIGLVICWLFG